MAKMLLPAAEQQKQEVASLLSELEAQLTVGATPRREASGLQTPVANRTPERPARQQDELVHGVTTW
jgi:hypothetical protein